MLYFDSGR
jgi:hypothetical protein